MKQPARILIIKTHAIGDLLMATPAIRDLRLAYPSAHIALLVGSWSAPAIRKNPNINEIIEFEDKVLLDRHWLSALRLLLLLRRKKFDAAFIFHPLPFLHFLALLARIPLRYGLMRSGGGKFLTKGVVEDLGNDQYYPENFQKVVSLAGAKIGNDQLEIHTDLDDERQAKALLGERGISAGEGFLLVGPGGGRNSKEDVASRRWPKEHFAELLKRIRQNQPNLKIVVCGSEGDREETSYLTHRVPALVDLTARTTLTQLFSIARLSSAIVCNDSSLLHIGIACQTPVVVPFGPTSLLQRIPEWDRRFCLQSQIACSPCYIGGHFPGCPIGFQCMKEILPGQMVASVEAALNFSGREGVA